MATMYVAFVELATRHLLEVAEVSTTLEEFHPVTTTGPDGRIELQITYPAQSLTHAGVKAVATVRAATGAEAIAYQVMTLAEYDARTAVEAGTRSGRHAAPTRDHPVPAHQPVLSQPARTRRWRPTRG